MKLQKTTLNDQLLMYQQDQIQDKFKINNNTKNQYRINNLSNNNLFNNKSTTIIINYDHIIDMQSSMIQALYKQCTLLRQHIKRLEEKQKLLFTIDKNNNNCKNQQLSNKIINSSKSQIGNNVNISRQQQQKQQQSQLQSINIEEMTKIIQSSILKQISTVLNIPEQQSSRARVIQTIKRLLWERNKRMQPIFIQSKKEVRVPVLVEVIVDRPVEKIVYKERIVYKEKIVEVPVFREKIVEKLGLVIEDNINTSMKALSTASNASSGNDIDSNNNKLENYTIKSPKNYNNYSNYNSPKNYYNGSSKNNMNPNGSSNKSYISPKQSQYDRNPHLNSNNQLNQKFYKSNKFNNMNNNKNNNNSKYDENLYYEKTLSKNPSNKTLHYVNKQTNRNKPNNYYDYDDEMI